MWPLDISFREWCSAFIDWGRCHLTLGLYEYSFYDEISVLLGDWIGKVSKVERLGQN